MTSYTSTQLQVLASACERLDGIAVRPTTLNRTAAMKVAARLLKEGLLQEVSAKRTWPVWRTGEDGKPISLKILKPGRAVAKAATKEAAAQNGAAASSSPAVEPKAAPSDKAGDGAATPASVPASLSAPAQAKAGSKRNLILGLMQREGGATITDLTTATGWLPHTTRAALTGLRKSGITIARSQDAESQSSVYRVVASAAA